MTIARKPFQNTHTRQLLNPGDPVIGYSQTEIGDLERNGLVYPSGPKETVVAPAPVPVTVPTHAIGDAGGDAGASVPATTIGRTVTAKRTLRSAIGGE